MTTISTVQTAFVHMIQFSFSNHCVNSLVVPMDQEEYFDLVADVYFGASFHATALLKVSEYLLAVSLRHR